MSTTNFNLRGIAPNVMMMLKNQAEKERSSVNLLILKYIEQGIGFSHQVKRLAYHDLDHMAGTWGEKDAKLFNDNTQYFEKIDKDIW